MPRDLACDVFADGPDVAAVLDRSGTVVAVNDAWDEAARAGGGDHRCGVGADYVAACQAGVAMRAPGAHLAYESVRAVLTGRRQTSSSTYPCGSPHGLRWFRSDVFALGRGDGVCVRHLDVTAATPVAGVALPFAEPPVGPGGDEAARFLDGLAELLRRVRPAHVMVLVCGVPADRSGLDRRTAGLVRLAVVQAAGNAVSTAAHVDLFTRLDAGEIAVAASGPSLAAVVGAADGIRARVSEHLRDRLRWGLALAGDGPGDPAGLLDRARSALHEAAVTTARSTAWGVEAVARSTALQRSAQRLCDAVIEFDAALDEGLSLTDLVLRDQEVAAAERDCERCAVDLTAR